MIWWMRKDRLPGDGASVRFALDWTGAIEKARAGTRFPSEELGSDTGKKSKPQHPRGQGKGKGKQKALSISSESPESEEALVSGDSDYSGGEDDVVVKQEPKSSADTESRRRSARFANVKSEGTGVKVEPDADVKDEPDVPAVVRSSSRRSSRSSLSSVQPQNLFIPEDSELNFASDSASEVFEATEDLITLTPEEWEVDADQWADLDDDGWYEQLHLGRKRSGTLSSNISDHEDRKRLKSSDVQSHGTGSTAESSSAAGPSHTVASGSTSTASAASIAASGPSKTTKPIVPHRPRRGFGVPEAAYDPWK
ncbi:hypothetical protein B0H11DRAFT_2012575 [Mycena galericulata]|nr:hypothetical protein B0H11DRAFT_2012575 [Mycena galericulata]